MRYKRKRDKCFWTMARSYLHDYNKEARRDFGKRLPIRSRRIKQGLGKALPNKIPTGRNERQAKSGSGNSALPLPQTAYFFLL